MRIPLLIAVLLSALTAFFSWRMSFMDVPLRIALEGMTGEPVSFSSVEYRPFNRITLNNFTVGRNFRCDRATVYVNPFTLILHYKRPESALSGIHFRKPWLRLSRELQSLAQKPGLRPGGGGPAPRGLKISWENGELVAGSHTLTRFSGRVKTTGGIDGRMAGRSGGHTVSITVKTKESAAVMDGEMLVKVSGPETEVEISAHATRGSDQSINASLELTKARWRRFSLSGSTVAVAYGPENFMATLNGEAGGLTLRGKDLSHFDFNGDLALALIWSGAGGRVSVSGTRSGGSVDGSAQLSGLALTRLALGDASFSFTRRSTEPWKARGVLNPSGCTFAATASDRGELAMYLQAGKNGFGKIFGRLAPLDLETRFSNWPLENVPLLSPVYPGLSGFANVEGRISGDEWKLDLQADQCRLGATGPFSIGIRLLRKGEDWFCKSESPQQGWAFSGKLLGRKDWDVTLSFKECRLPALAAMARLDLPLDGRISGTASYSSARKGASRLEISGLSWQKTLLGDGKLDAELDPECARIKEFSLHQNRGTVVARAEVGLLPGANDCLLDLTFHHYPLKDNELHGKLGIAGDLDPGKQWRFSGRLQSERFQFNKWVSRPLSSEIALSREGLELRDLAFLPFGKGNLGIRFKDMLLHGRLTVLDFPLKDIVTAVQGRLQGTALLSGTLSSPRVNFTYAVPDTVFRNLSFAQSGTLLYSGGSVFAEKVTISSGTSVLTMNGTLWPEMSVTGVFDRLPAPLLATLGKLPLQAGGSFSGSLEAKGPFRALRAALEIEGQGLSLNGRPVSEFKSRMKIADRTILVESLSAKFSDSELRLLAGSSVKLDARRFTVISDWRNVHLGPLDVFGAVRFTGSWQDIPGRQPAVNATLSSDNLWLNRFNLTSFSSDIQYRDGEITFLPDENRSPRISGRVDFTAYPELRFRDLSLNSGRNRTLVIDGIFGEKRWDFTVKGKSVSAEAVSELLDLPVTLAGDTDVNIFGRGSLDQPQLEGSLNISGGTLSEVPFDSLNVQVSARQDVITIIRAKLIRKDQYTINATGFSPFYLTARGKQRVQNNPLNLSFNIEEGSLDILRGLTGDIKSASGNLRAQAHITGTFSLPEGNGYLKIANGEVSLNRYFSRVSGINVDCFWKDNVITIREFAAKIGEGTTRLKGSVALSGLKPRRYDLSWETEGKKGVPISIPELPIPTPLLKSEDWEFLSNFSYGEPRFSLSFAGPAHNPLLAGWIELDNTHFTYPPLVKGERGENLLDGLWPLLSWNLELRAGKNCWYDNELASVNIQGGIKLTGKGAVPAASGHVEALRGEITYFGTEFKVQQARIEIMKGACYLEAEAETTIYGATSNDADTIQMFIDKAEIGSIQPRFISRNNPDLTPEQAMAKATGLNPDSISSSELSYFLRRSLIRFFDSTLTTPLAKNFLRRSGLVDSFHVQYLSQETPARPTDPANPTLSELLSGTKYSLEKYLTDRVLFGYSMTFDQIRNRLDLRHELELSYNLRNNLFLKGSYELESTNALRQYDRRITLEQQFRFGLPHKKKPAALKQ
ncbi:MAG: translocation/assembly module TamB domain-containing protein [Endomicrobiales bacterium]